MQLLPLVTESTQRKPQNLQYDKFNKMQKILSDFDKRIKQLQQ